MTEQVQSTRLRRTVVPEAAWSIPVVVASATAPELAAPASECPEVSPPTARSGVEVLVDGNATSVH